MLVEKGPLTAIRLPGMLVALSGREPTAGSQGTVMDHFGFKVRDIDAFLSKWREAGLPVMSEFTGAEGFPNAYVMAPDDVRVELQQDTTLSVESPPTTSTSSRPTTKVCSTGISRPSVLSASNVARLRRLPTRRA